MPIIDEGYVSADGHVVEPADLWTDTDAATILKQSD